MDQVPPIQIISYEEYNNGKENMNDNDKTLFNSFVYQNPLDWNDTEQMIASLKGIIPADIDRYTEIAKNRSVTGMAHDLDSK